MFLKTLGISTSERQLKYYGVDRVESMNDSNYKSLSEHSVKTIVQYLNINSQTSWKNLITLAEKYNMNIVIFPDQGGDVSGCGWENPFNNPVNDNYINRVIPMLDYFNNVNNWPNGKIRIIGIVTSHEPMWNQTKNSDGSYKCHTQIADLAKIKSQLKTYVNRPDFKIWAYIDNVSDINAIKDYSQPLDYEKIMDVAATWQHCFAVDPNNAPEGNCNGALAKIKKDRELINNAGLDGKIDLVFLFQTFAQGGNGGYRMPSASEMHDWSISFLNTGALDGFMYYTWGACWYSSDLYCPSSTHPNQNLWPLMNSIYDEYVNNKPPTDTPTHTPTKPPTTYPLPTTKPATQYPTNKPTNKPTVKPTIRPTVKPTIKPITTVKPTAKPLSKTINIQSISYSLSKNWLGQTRLKSNTKIVYQETGNPAIMTRVYFTLTNTKTGKIWSSSGYTDNKGIQSYTINESPNGCYKISISKITSLYGLTWDNLIPQNEYCYN